MHVLPMIVPADNQVSLLKFYYFIFVYCFLNQLVSLLVHFFQEDQIFLFLCDCHLEGGASNLHHRGRRNRESSSGWSSSTKFNDIQMPILPFFIDRNKTLYHFYFEYKLNCMQKFEFIKFFIKFQIENFSSFLSDSARIWTVAHEMIQSVSFQFASSFSNGSMMKLSRISF